MCAYLHENGMEILIFSDSHGNTRAMCDVIAMHPQATHILFCGDGIRDLDIVCERFPKQIFVAVRGNCDLFGASDIPYERIITLGKIKILMMHGHTYGVKGGYGAAASFAAKEGVDILLCGHTHMPYDERVTVKERAVQVFNPGSIGKRDGGALFYGVLVIRENGFLLSHGKAYS